MKIGIALAAYEPHLIYFREQLRSIQEQTYRNWICVLSFDSPMAALWTEPSLRSFREDSRFIWSENTRRLGHKKNFEHAIQLALRQEANVIGCADQDDVWYPEKLEISAERLKRVGPLAMVHSDMDVLENGTHFSGTVWKIERRGIRHTQPEHLLVRNVVSGCSMLFDAELARRFPRIPDSATYHDQWYALVASCFGGVHPISIPLFAYRQHLKNKVGVRPFKPGFSIDSSGTIPVIVKRYQRYWLMSHRLAMDAIQERVPLGPLPRRIFTSAADFGFRLLLMSASNSLNDPLLARGCLHRAIGKALHCVVGARPSHSDA